MKRTPFALVAMAALLLSACANSNTQSVSASASPSPSGSVASAAELERAVAENEKRMWELAKAKKVQEYRGTLTPGYMSLSWDAVRNADEDAQSLTAYDIKDYSLSEFHVTFPNPDTAILTYKAKVTEGQKGFEQTNQLHPAAVWVRQNGEWKCALYTANKQEAPKK